MNLKNATSLNNKIIVEPYKKGELKSKIENGFAFVEQKTNLCGLKILMTAESKDLFIPEGAVAYIKEESLYTQAWAKKIFECDGIGKFIIVDVNFVEFIVLPGE